MDGVYDIRSRIFAREFGEKPVNEYLLFSAKNMPLRFRKWFWDWKGGEFGIFRYYMNKDYIKYPIRSDIDRWLRENGADKVNPPYCVLVETG